MINKSLLRSINPETDTCAVVMERLVDSGYGLTLNMLPKDGNILEVFEGNNSVLAYSDKNNNTIRLRNALLNFVKEQIND